MTQHFSSDQEFVYSIDTLKSYILGTLDSELTLNIALAEKDSEELATKIEGIRFLLQEKGEEGFQAYMQESLNSHKNTIKDWSSDKESSNSFPRRYQIAAAILLLLGISAYFLWSAIYTEDYQQFVSSELSKPYPLILSQNIRGTSYEKTHWEIAYEAEDFAATVSHLDSKSKLNEMEHFYRGFSLIRLSEYEKSLTDFDEVQERQNVNGFLDQALWYKAMSYIQIGNNAQATSILEKIAKDSGHFKNKEAQKLWSLLQKEASSQIK